MSISGDGVILLPPEKRISMKITQQQTSHGPRFCISYQHLSKRRRKYFKRREDAEVELSRLLQRRREEGNAFATYTDAERFEMVAAFERAKTMHTTLPRALDAMLLAEQERARRQEPLGRYDRKGEEGFGAVQECIEEKIGRNYRKRSIQSLASTLNRFSLAHPNIMVGDLTRQIIFNWLARGKKANGEAWKSKTKNGYLTDLATFCSWAVKRGLLVGNPAEDVDDFLMTPEEERELDERVEVIRPDQLATLMRAAFRQDKGVARLLSIIYFGGLRTEREAGMMEEEHIGAKIHVPRRLAKDRQERVFTPHPTLAAWLKATGEERLPLSNQDKRVKAVIKAARLTGKIPRNAGRHSFASYHLVLAGKQATLDVLGHASDQMLFSNYRSVVSVEEAENYFKIRPEKTCATNGI
tara:strand:- start:312 stop:1547 length:1236 start_codon:yes stop_codon:yes gene_type:complete